MHILQTIPAFRQTRASYPQLGFVPTMGYLHEGHLHLVRQAKADCGAVAVSIFVNPTQFGPNEDFATYPRDEERDLALLQAEGVAMVFLPSPDEMYPQPFYTAVEVETITTQLEGAARPGHFRGVATIVAKLLNIVQPDRTYFGQKDAQQTIVIRRMVHDLNIPGEMVVVPTVREPDGLAMSSRNTYLAPDERQAATILYRALLAAQERYKQGERNGEVLRGVLHEVLASEPLARVEYVSAAHPHTLQEQQQITNAGVLLSLAVRIGKTRLIDNILLGTEANEHEKS